MFAEHTSNRADGRAEAASGRAGRPIRVAMIVHVMQVAGAEMLVRATIERLGSAIEPTVFCLDQVGLMGEELRAAGVPVVCLNRRPGRDWRVSLRLAAEVKARGVEVLHAHQYSPFFYGALSKARCWPRMPWLIFTEHGRHFPDAASPMRRAMNRLVLDRLADEVNACIGFSARALRDVDGFRGHRIRVIENGIEVARYHPVADVAAQRRLLGLDERRRYLVHVARFHPVKDQAVLLRGFAAAAENVPDVDLLLAGDGPLRGDLEALASALGISKRVRFLGIRRDVPAVLQAADVFALTSQSEAASLTLLEAMATGLPAIVTAVGGNPEIVRHEQEGLLIPRGDWAACGQAIVRLFREPELIRRLGANARARVLERYRLEQTITAYWELYRRLARPGLPRASGMA